MLLVRFIVHCIQKGFIPPKKGVIQSLHILRMNFNYGRLHEITLGILILRFITLYKDNNQCVMFGYQHVSMISTTYFESESDIITWRRNLWVKTVKILASPLSPSAIAKRKQTRRNNNKPFSAFHVAFSKCNSLKKCSESTTHSFRTLTFLLWRDLNEKNHR